MTAMMDVIHYYYYYLLVLYHLTKVYECIGIM